MLFASILSGFIGSMAGLVLSYYYDIPSGAAIIFTLVIFYGLASEKVIFDVVRFQ